MKNIERWNWNHEEREKREVIYLRVLRVLRG